MSLPGGWHRNKVGTFARFANTIWIRNRFSAISYTFFVTILVLDIIFYKIILSSNHVVQGEGKGGMGVGPAAQSSNFPGPPG